MAQYNVPMMLLTWHKGPATVSEDVYVGTDPANLAKVSCNANAEPGVFRHDSPDAGHLVLLACR